MTQRRALSYPLRDVHHARLRVAASIIGSFRYHYWDLELVCGHRVEREVRREPGHGKVPRGFAALHHPRPPETILPAPRRVRCYLCGPDPENEEAG